MQPFQYPTPEIRIEAGELTDIVRFKLHPNSALVVLGTENMAIPAHWQDRFNQLQSLEPKSDTLMSLTGSSKPAVILFCKLKRGLSPFEQLTTARKLMDKYKHLVVEQTAFYLAHPEVSWLNAFLSAALANRFELPNYQSDFEPRKPTSSLLICGKSAPTLDIDRLLSEAMGNALARHLAVTPASELTPEIYRAYALKLALEQQWHTDWFSQERLKDMGAGAFTAVSQGSNPDSGGILKLSYRPAGYVEPAAEQEQDQDQEQAEQEQEKAGSKTPTVALVGKGLCFDTGGYNLKTGGYMYGMHLDMGGSAVALGTLLALSRLKVPFAVDCYLALAENHIGPEAYKPNDLVTALNGTTIEVVDTDAEGRMVLADTLTLATAEKPDLVIDYATLTGACVRAIGTRYSGAFTNQAHWIPQLMALGKRSGERIWPFPLDKDFDDHIESKIADVLQCAPSASTDHIDAARFLSRFIEHETPWLHLDLSAFKPKGDGLAHVAGEVSGFGVRLTLEALLGDENLWG